MHRKPPTTKNYLDKIDNSVRLKKKILVLGWAADKSSLSFSKILFFFGLFRVTPSAYGGSQARGWIRAVAAGLCQSHSNARPELPLWPTQQLMAMPDPQPTEQGQGSNLQPHGSQSDLFPLCHNGNSHINYYYSIIQNSFTSLKRIPCSSHIKLNAHSSGSHCSG